MSLCINPNCTQLQNVEQHLYCVSCGSKLLINEIYRVTKLLGEGGFGTTYEVNDGSTTKVLKVLRSDLEDLEQRKAIELFEREFQVLSKLNHPGIPKVGKDDFFPFSLPSSRLFIYCLVMEKIEGMDLERWMEKQKYQPITEQSALRWIKQTVEILGEVHRQRYFHRDIKPSNIMLRTDNEQLALIDFGGVKEVAGTSVQQQKPPTRLVSAGYTPSEQENGRTVLQSDFFALGRTFVYLLTGKELKHFSENLDGRLIWRKDALQVSEAFLNLLDELMAPLPQHRPHNAEVILRRIAVIEQPSPQPTITLPPPPTKPSKKSNTLLPQLQSAHLSSNLFIRVALLGFEGGLLTIALGNVIGIFLGGMIIGFSILVGISSRPLNRILNIRILSIVTGITVALTLIFSAFNGLSYVEVILLSTLFGSLFVGLIILFQLLHRFWKLVFRNW